MAQANAVFPKDANGNMMTTANAMPLIWVFILGALQQLVALGGSGPGGAEPVAITGPLGAQTAAASLAVVDTPLINKQFALNGSVTVIADTSPHTGTWSSFYVVTAAVFTSCTGLGGTSGITFAAGSTIFAPITAFTLASGAIIPYPA